MSMFDDVVLPSVWGGNSSAPPHALYHGCSGYLFGFSGLSGPTNETAGFVAIATLPGYSLSFCALSQLRNFTLQPAGGVIDKTFVATSDVLVAGAAASSVRAALSAPDAVKMVWESKDKIVGTAPAGTVLAISGSTAWRDGCTVSGDDIALCRSGSSAGPITFALAHATSAAAAVSLANDTVGLNLTALISERLQPYRALPKVAKEYAPLLAKALSVMRVNSLAPEGHIRTRWSTPDRVPHRWMWLWDSCYHSLAANRLDPSLGWDYLEAVLAAAAPDGAIAIERTPDTAGGGSVDQTQPPLLAWAVWENQQAALKAGVAEKTVRARLAYALPRLEAYLSWDIVHRVDPTGATHLLWWLKGTESGMDNSPRFGLWHSKQAPGMLAVDFSVYFAREAAYVARMANYTGDARTAGRWARLSQRVSAEVHSTLWDDRTGLYYDRYPETAASGSRAGANEGTLSRVASPTGLLPMWLDDFPKNRLPRLLSAMRDPSTFGTAVPLATVARNASSFSTDMWRGPMWININYMVARALLANGEAAEARTLMRKTLDCMAVNYRQYGVLFEFYDADGHADPRYLMRKGTHGGGVRDYHWTAALAFEMILLLEAP